MIQSPEAEFRVQPDSGQVRHLEDSTAFKGAVIEMEVSVDLLKRGFIVYRNVTPVGPVDMVAVSPEGHTMKVQATMGRFNGRNRSYSDHKDAPHWNVIAVRYPDGVRYYNRQGDELCLPSKEGARYEDILEEELRESEWQIGRMKQKLDELVTLTPKKSYEPIWGEVSEQPPSAPHCDLHAVTSERTQGMFLRKLGWSAEKIADYFEERKKERVVPRSE